MRKPGQTCDRGDAFGLIEQEATPGRRRSVSSSHHILGNRQPVDQSFSLCCVSISRKTPFSQPRQISASGRQWPPVYPRECTMSLIAEAAQLASPGARLRHWRLARPRLDSLSLLKTWSARSPNVHPSEPPVESRVDEVMKRDTRCVLVANKKRI